MEKTGLVHIYCGDGKGKTTAAVGLSVRAAGAGNHVVFSQFFKDGSSAEILLLKKLADVCVMNCQTVPGRASLMNDAERAQAGADYRRFLEQVFRVAEEADLLVLDEVISACNYGIVEEERVMELLARKPRGLEVVMTGREPSRELLKAADYITEMRKLRHPYDRGVAARYGIEF